MWTPSKFRVNIKINKFGGVGIMKRRNWSVDEKMSIVLESLSGKVPIADICRRHQISQTLFYLWRDKFLEGGRKSLNGKKEQSNSCDAEIEKLQKIIGKQTVQIEILKKTQELLGKR